MENRLARARNLATLASSSTAKKKKKKKKKKEEKKLKERPTIK